MEAGTIGDLILRPGDVVECIYAGFDTWKVGERYTMTADGLECEFEVPQKSSLSKFRIISRASDDTPKLWRDMRELERANVYPETLNDPTNPLQIPWGEWIREAKGALLLAKHEGKVIEAFIGSAWCKVSNQPILAGGLVYRVKPEPVRETFTHEQWVSMIEGSSRGFFGLLYSPVCPEGDVKGQTTIETVDGKPVKVVWEADSQS